MNTRTQKSLVFLVLICAWLTSACSDGENVIVEVEPEHKTEDTQEVIISSPIDGTEIMYTHPLLFEAQIISQGQDTLKINSATWHSSLDGSLSDLSAFSDSTLSPGNHNISLKVVLSDDSELNVQADISVHIGEIQPQLSFNITSSNQEIFLDTDFFNLSASIQHPHGGDVKYNSFSWHSDLDNDLSQRRFNDQYLLSPGLHKLALQVSFLDGSILNTTKEVDVQDDPRGQWLASATYNGIGADLGSLDGLALESDHFLIFSNITNTSRRLIISEYAERALEELKASFDLDALQTTKKILIGQDKRGGSGFVGINAKQEYSMYVGMPEFGFVSLGPDEWNDNIEGIKHELMHILELTYMRRSPTENTTHRWFWEGIAVYESRGEIPSSWLEVQSWRAETNGNPISIKQQPTGTSSNDGHFYPLFGLTLSYLLSPEGNNSTHEDVLLMYKDIEAGSTFEDAFHRHFGLTVDQLETEYFVRIESFLN